LYARLFSLAPLLSLESDLEVVLQVGRADEVVPAAINSLPDVAAARHRMPGGDRLDAVAELARPVPGCRVVILATYARPGYPRRALEGRASGFVAKEAPAEQLVDAIRRAMAGEQVVDPVLAITALRDGPSNSPICRYHAGHRPMQSVSVRRGRRDVASKSRTSVSYAVMTASAPLRRPAFADVHMDSR
jgi:DNA-binding NarL/FixJ family response regulator